jgi:group I intron endonuclease
MTSGVYRIYNVANGHAYIGSAVNVKSRWAAHRHTLRTKGKSPPKLQRAWDKYGESAFVFSVVELCDKDQLLAREQHFIDLEKPYYNTRQVAHSNFGVRWSAETNNRKGRVRNTFTVRGVTGSVRELSEHFGVVSQYTARSRMDRGATPEEAVTAPIASKQTMGSRAAASHKRNGSHPMAKPLTAFGVTAPLYKLVPMFATMGIKSVRQRIARGVDVETALTAPKRGWK